MSDENKVSESINAVTGLVKAVPIYQDLAQPAAKELGTGLGHAVHFALKRIGYLAYGWEHVEVFLWRKLMEKLSNVPPGDVVAPPPNVAGPLIDLVRFSGGDESLCDMYANLLATAMDSKTAHTAHPAFVEIIRQLTPDEARIISTFSRERFFPVITIRTGPKSNPLSEETTILKDFSLIGEDAGCQHPSNTRLYLDNICRLGLAEIQGAFYTAPGIYDRVESDARVVELMAAVPEGGTLMLHIRRKMLAMTELGLAFANACVAPHGRPLAEGEAFSLGYYMYQ